MERRFESFVENVRAVNSIITCALGTAGIAGAFAAICYYMPLHFFPIYGAGDAGALLVTFGTIGLLFVALLLLPFIAVVPLLRTILAAWPRVLGASQDKKQSRKVIRDRWALLLCPPLGASVLFFSVIILATEVRKFWMTGAVLYAAIGVLFLLVPWAVKYGRTWRCTSSSRMATCIKLSRDRKVTLRPKTPRPKIVLSRRRTTSLGLTGFWMILFIPVSVIWSLLGGGLHGLWWALYLSVVLLTGGWLAIVLLFPNNVLMRLTYASILFIVAALASHNVFSRNMVNRIVNVVGVRENHATVILTAEAGRLVRMRCGQECKHRPHQIRSAGTADRSGVGRRLAPDMPSGISLDDDVVRGVVMISALGSRYLLGFPLSSAPSDPKCTAAPQQRLSQCKNIVLLSNDIVAWWPSTSRKLSHPQGGVKGAKVKGSQSVTTGGSRRKTQ